MVRFPPVDRADPHGLLCISERITPELLWAAYRQGIFPWTDEPVGWFAPAARGLLWPSEAHFPRNLGKYWRRAGFRITLDAAFAAVVAGCQRAHRAEGEWLTDRLASAYVGLAAAGHAHSVEVWQGEALVGGVYGVAVGSLFSAESMFKTVDYASRAAMYALVEACGPLGIEAIDVQVLSPASLSLGAREIPRAEFMQLLADCLTKRVPATRRWPHQLCAHLTMALPAHLRC